MKPDFSEFSYGYAVTEEIVASHKAVIVGAPMFPSLYEEGKKGGGYDVKIPLAGKPVFLQFKLSDYLKKRSAAEHQSGLLKVPYYRMHLRPLRHSEQHNLLLDLEAVGETVFYIAPEFHLPKELNDYYLGKAVVRHSAAFRPGDIGTLPDDDEHYIAFRKGEPTAYRCSSEPVKIKKRSLKDGFLPLLASADVHTRVLDEPGMRAIVNRMVEVLRHAEERFSAREKPVDLEGIRRIASLENPQEALGYVARTFFDAEFLVVPSESIP